jgi:hypothetical protein
MTIFDDEEDMHSSISGALPVTRFDKRGLTNARSRFRNAIQRDLAKAEERQRKAAGILIAESAARFAAQNDPRNKLKKRNNALVYTVAELSKAVVRSLDVNTRVDVSMSTHIHGPVSGITNFEEIDIKFNPEAYNPDNLESVVTFIKCLKGALYHEAGHLKFSVPIGQIERNKDDVVGFDDVVYTEPCLARYPATKDLFGKPISRHAIQTAWNILEDQRMETAMCSVSPNMARYFSELVQRVVINYTNPTINWPWLVGRTYLPKALRQTFRNAAEHHPNAHLIDRINTCVMTYRASRDYVEMANCIIEFANLMAAWGHNDTSDIGRHFVTYTTRNGDVTPDSIPEPEAFDLESALSGESASAKPDSPEEPGSEKTAGPDSGDGTSTSEYQGDTNTPTDGDLTEAKRFVETTNEIAQRAILPNSSQDKMSEHDRAASIDVANRMLDVLEDLASQGDPSWVFRQEEGVLDPTSYALREPGDTDYWIGLVGDSSPGHNLAVSVLIDSSGSMHGSMEGVSVAAVGIKKACYELGIPCTVTTFSDNVEMLFDGDSPYDYVSVAPSGGTHPLHAFMDLDNQKFGKHYHLVVVLTDGEWSDTPSVTPWVCPNRNIILVGFKLQRDFLSNKGADSVFEIHRPNELPALMTNALVGYFV